MARSLWVTLGAAWLALCSVVALGDALDGVLQVRSAFVDLDHSVFQLHARVDYPETQAISDALRDGVDLLFDVDAALQYLGTVDGWPILVEPQLEPGAKYVISVRAGIHRGHLSSSLRALLFWTDDWSRVSGWYTWSLTT